MEVGREVGVVEDASLVVTEAREVSSGGWMKSSEMLLFFRVDSFVTRSLKSYTVVVASTGECRPVRVSIGVTPGNAAELATALSPVAHAENNSIKTDLSAKDLRGDRLGQKLAVRHATSKLTAAFTQVTPGEAAFVTAVATAATLRWMVTLMV